VRAGGKASARRAARTRPASSSASIKTVPRSHRVGTCSGGGASSWSELLRRLSPPAQGGAKRVSGPSSPPRLRQSIRRLSCHQPPIWVSSAPTCGRVPIRGQTQRAKGVVREQQAERAKYRLTVGFGSGGRGSHLLSPPGDLLESAVHHIVGAELPNLPAHRAAGMSASGPAMRAGHVTCYA
jgi:hypothetical protein